MDFFDTRIFHSIFALLSKIFCHPIHMDRNGATGVWQESFLLYKYISTKGWLLIQIHLYCRIKVELLPYVRCFDHTDGPQQTWRRISVIRVQCLTVCCKYMSPECVRRMALHYVSAFHLYTGPNTNCERLVIAYAFGRVEKWSAFWKRQLGSVSFIHPTRFGLQTSHSRAPWEGSVFLQMLLYIINSLSHLELFPIPLVLV